MILSRRLALGKSPNDRRLGFPIGQRRRYEILFDVFHTAILLALAGSSAHPCEGPRFVKNCAASSDKLMLWQLELIRLRFG